MTNRRGMALAIIVVGVLMIGAIFLPGSQPGQGRPLEDPANCGCHRGYDPVVEPMYNWRGSMMSLAARDPIFFAALDLANHDLPDAGTFCLRCHTPSAHQGGRTTLDPTGNNLTGIDLEGVFCDVCHAMVNPLSAEGQALVDPDVTSYGNAMYVFTEGQEKRGPFDDAQARHVWQFSAFHRTSEVCASCHDVSNPLLCDPTDPYNVQKCFVEQRTYSEWKNSYYATLGEAGNCQACHMPYVADGKACNQGPTRTFLPVHHQSGGNYWIPDAIQFLYPKDKQFDFAALASGKARAISLLQSSATLEATDETDTGPGRVSVRITNHTGHKLPTGYPEGRRMWINVIGYDASEAVVFESGAYDLATATLLPDDQEKIYEAHFGVLQGDGSCQVSFRLVQNNCLEKDNRIPPRGFTNAAFAAVGAGHMHYHYEDGQYWDDTPYVLPANVYRIVVNLYYQTTTREYIEFIASAPGSGARGATVLNAFNNTGKAAPVTMETFALVFDTDKDGMGDAFELAYGLNPNSAADAATDLDGDGLTNLEEYQLGIFPNDSDSDDDGLSDGAEIDTWFTDPLDPDCDLDGLDDGQEVLVIGSNPLLADSDGGGEGDASEYYLGRNPLDPADDGELAQYDPTLGAPRCLTGRGVCLVGEDLIGGRDHILNGNEPNQPNTILTDPCADGASGTFHLDESINELVVTDLSNFDFVAGDTVEVQARVWCWTNVGLDEVHIFNGNSTDGWNYLGSAACSVVGQEVLSVTGQLADRPGDQAIRAVFAFESLPTTCDGGSYSDHDDVMFAVGAPAGMTDTDGDGLTDAEEAVLGTNPNSWDTDQDNLPDGFEVGNMSGHTAGNLNPLNSADGNTADFDGDGITNAHDYYNAGGGNGNGGAGISGNGVYVADKVGWPACGYWADGDGDGFVAPADISVISSAIKGSPNYSAVYPPNGETLDLDSDTFISPSDSSLLSSMIKGQILDPLNSRPSAIARVTPATGVTPSGAVGETLSVIVAVTNTATNPAPGIPIIFSIDPSSTGAATIIGGEGVDAALTRYDLSTDVASGGKARVTVLLTGTGTVVINAKVAECGTGGVGRYCAEVVLGEPVVVTVGP